MIKHILMHGRAGFEGFDEPAMRGRHVISHFHQERTRFLVLMFNAESGIYGLK